MPFVEPSRTLPNNKPTKLDNVTCIYCSGRGMIDNPLTDEHVIGRRFVPKGSLAASWSFIAKACNRCNHAKSQLEDDISAITLLPEIGTTHEDPTLQAIAQRKGAGSRSRYTGKPVARSYHQNSMQGTLMGGALSLNFGFIGPPRLEEQRVLRLAYFHVSAFFYLITYEEVQRTGNTVPEEFLLVNIAGRSDWGNPVQRAFADFTSIWHSRVEGSIADGFFRIAIRRDSTGMDIWSFALEWNKSLRCIGFFGNSPGMETYVFKLHKLVFKEVNDTYRSRRAIPLMEADDRLFEA
jgi:hypothetical protein